MKHYFFITGLAGLILLFACSKEDLVNEHIIASDCIEQLRDSLVCPTHIMPVCGCNGKTYTNSCEAEAHAVFNYVDGPCSSDCVEQSRDSLVCPTHIMPVCGCNGKTYTNSCEAEAYGIFNYFDGPCVTTF